ncbi:MAG: peptide transporter substrate-binding protein, partial [Dehalococcoidia bacterium]|nr:peptide transporter substrate-binding protein [Dehalococcoidia bacterium]
DVQASIDYYLRPPEPRRTPGTRQLGHITGVSCPDGAKGYTAVISFNQVLAKTLGSLTKDLAMVDKGWIGWYVANHFDAMGTASPLSHSLATGTGPMVPLEYQPDVVAKLRRNPSYFREGLPLVDGMDNYILKDFTTRFTALATGQIHWFGSGSSSLLPGQVAQAERDFKDKIVLHSNLHTFPSGEAEFNMNRAPYNDRRVRQAINLTVSRDDWLLFKTAGTYPMARLVGYMEPYPDFYWGTPEEVLRTWPGIRQPKDQDIAEANRLLDEVFGKGKRFNTTCITRNAQNYMEYCLFFADQARKLGITVTMQPYELAVINTLTDVCNYDVYASVGTATTGDPDARLYRYSWAYEQVTGGKCALEGITAAEPALQAEIAAMIAAQTSEPDPVKRGEILRALDKKLTQELVHQIHYGWIKIFYGTAPNLKGYTLAGFPVFTYSIFERVWLAK